MYVACDFAVYFAQKHLRNDVRHWLNVDGWLEVVASLGLRFLVKFVADFTAMPQLRAPGELGGIYYMCNIFSGLAFCLIYMHPAVGGGGAFGMGGGELWNLVGGMMGFWVLNTACFFGVINRE